MKFVQQRGAADCAIAALAMFCEKSYEEIVSLLEGEGKERYEAGLGTESTTNYEVCDMLNMEVYFYSPDKLDKNRPAILSVPSLNKEGTHHSVVWTGTELLDPNEGRVGKLTYSKHELPRKINSILQEIVCDNKN